MYLLILFLPLLGFFYSSGLGKFFGRACSAFFAVFSVFLAFLLSIFALYEVAWSHTIVEVPLFSWALIETYSINFGLLFDTLSCSMLIIINGISFFVHLYSIGYMSHDPHLSRFMGYLSFFTFCMLALVTANNYVQLFIGWEGVGLCSFLLINFWYTRILATKAALKAMIMNRIADVFFILAIIMMLLTFRSTDYFIVFTSIDFVLDTSFGFLGFSLTKIDFISLLLLVGGIGKSAQLGLHTWLPDAMQGPTPVSALLHAATMVTAGVFLLIRSSPILEYAPLVLLFASIIGAFTALFCAVIGVFQYDVKNIIAYSTCSQLGYMFLSCGLSNYHVAIFHLLNHAFFKALLFLSAGSIIHALFDEQDMRRMGGLANLLPFTYFAIFLGSLAIMGFPFLTGFYSKDLVIELVYSRYIVEASFIHLMCVVAAFFTAVYSTRFLLFVFFLKFNIFPSFFTSHESSPLMSISMFFLMAFSIFWGYLTSDLFVGWGTFYWANAIFVLPFNIAFIDTDFLPPAVKNLPLFFTFWGIIVGFLFINFPQVWGGSNIPYIYKEWWNKIHAFFFQAGFFNAVYNKFFFILFESSYLATNKYIDKGFLEFFGPFGFYKYARKLSLALKNATPFVIFFTVAWMFFFLVFILFFMVLSASFLSFFACNSALLFIVIILNVL